MPQGAEHMSTLKPDSKSPHPLITTRAHVSQPTASRA